MQHAFEPALKGIVERRQVRLLVHRASFRDRDCYFLNLTNHSRNREVVITHVWFDTVPAEHALQEDRPLPVRLKPDEPWETWVEAERLPTDIGDAAFTLGRAKLSTGRVIKSRKNKTVPSAGAIPGGPIQNPFGLP